MKRTVASYIIIAILAVFGIGGIVAGSVAIRMVDNNLKEQNIAFGADSEHYANQKVTNGLDAYHFQSYIKGHVTEALKPVGFTTYEEVSAAARATVTKDNPAGDAKLMGLRRTALDGQLLRGTLFSSFAWWLVGWVGIAAGVAFLALAVCGYLVSRRGSTLYFPASDKGRETVSV